MDTRPAVDKNSQKISSPLPWWTWVLPFFIANLGTWLSISFKTDPGASLWYLPTAFGIVMAYWWGPRVLLGIYLNAVICTPLWDLPWQRSYLYALPETIEVALSWLIFIKLMRGKCWLPDLRNVGVFLFFGSFLPTSLANLYLTTQLLTLGDISPATFWLNWRIVFSGDMATQFVFAVPILIFVTKTITEKGWSVIKEEIHPLVLFPLGRDTILDKGLLGIIFVTGSLAPFFFSFHDTRIFYGFTTIFIAVLYGVGIAVLSASYIGIISFLIPIFAGGVDLPASTYNNFVTINIEILLLCGVTLVTGRAISDLFVEIGERKQSELNLRNAEDKYRTLVEQIPPIVYISGLDQHIGVTYISPQIKVLGYTQEEWAADPSLWFRQVHPDDQQRILDEIEQVKASGDPFKSEYRMLSRDGDTRWFLDEAMDVKDSNGKIIYRQGFMLDVTARKQAEENLSSREQFLELLNDMTRTILLSNNFEATLDKLAHDMSKLTQADDCYITEWDEERQMTIPTSSTASLESPFESYFFDPNKASMTASVIKIGRALAANDVLNSPYVHPDIVKRFPVSSMLGVPLIVGEHKLGAVIIAFRQPHHFTMEEIERAEQAGAQIALALWSFKQSIEIQQRLKESNALAQIGRALSATEHAGTSGILQLIADAARELIPQAGKSVIHLLDLDEQALIARAVSGYNEQDQEYGGVKMRLGEGVAGQVIREGKTINIGDITTFKNFISGKSIPSFQSLLVAPIQSGSQQIGTISVQSSNPNAFSAREANLLNALGVQAAIAIENANLFGATQQRLREVGALYRINQGLAASLDADQLINDVVKLLQQNFGYYHVQIYLIEPQNGKLLIQHDSRFVGSEILNNGVQIPAGEGIIGHVAETGEAFFTNNVDDVVFFKDHPLFPETQSEIAVPIKVEQKVVGVLDVQNTSENRFTEGDFQLMITVANQLAVALQRANLYGVLQAALQQEQAIRSQLIQSERLAVMGRLLASVSHELNNPLQAIQNALFLLKSEKGLSEQGHMDLDIVLAESERMAGLIERLRGTYRPTRAEEFKPTQLNTIIEDLYALIGTMLRHNNVTFEFKPDAKLPEIPAITDQIRQAVLNLMVNAVEAMSLRGGVLTISTKHQDETDEVLLSVSDTGPGISPEILPNIFDAFITNKETGTGLGLTITHDIILKHHGRIEAENNPTQGATFKVWLPKEYIEIE